MKEELLTKIITAIYVTGLGITIILCIGFCRMEDLVKHIQ